MMIFGHRKCSEGTGYISGHRKGVPGTPGKDMGLMGQERDRPAPGGLVRPHIGRIGGKGRRRRENERGGFGLPLSFLPPSPSFPLRHFWMAYFDSAVLSYVVAWTNLT